MLRTVGRIAQGTGLSAARRTSVRACATVPESSVVAAGEPQADRVTGYVKWYNIKTRHGVLIQEETLSNVWVRASAVKSKGYTYLKEGEKVEFTKKRAKNNSHYAVKVTAVGGAALDETVRDAKPERLSSYQMERRIPYRHILPKAPKLEGQRIVLEDELAAIPTTAKDLEAYLLER